MSTEYTLKQLSLDICGIEENAKKESADKNTSIDLSQTDKHIRYIAEYLIYDIKQTKEEKNVREINCDDLGIFSIFVSTQRDFLYNKGYLDGYIQEIETYISTCRGFFALCVDHFNRLHQEIPDNWRNKYTISYNDCLRFNYTKRNNILRWRANINPDDIAKLTHVRADKASFELSDENMKTVLAISFESQDKNYKINQKNHNYI